MDTKMRDMRFSGSKIFVVLLMIVITCFSVLMFDISDDSHAFSAGNRAYCIGTREDGGLASDIWQNDYGYFDKALLNEIYAKSTGIEGATLDDVSSYIDNSGVEKFNSKIVTADIIGQNAGEAYKYGGILVKVGGFDWGITSLTKDDQGNTIATLLFADPYDYRGTLVRKWNDSMENVKGGNMYSSSSARDFLNTDPFFSLFNGDFGSKYIAKPKNIAYQRSETAVGLYGGQIYNYINDALGALDSGWYSSDNSYEPSFTYKGIRYDAWGNDYLWLPSIAEVLPYNPQTSIWKITSGLLSINSSAKSNWLRSGHFSSKTNSMISNNSTFGTLGARSESIDSSNNVRPAFHLNLTAADADSKYFVKDPAIDVVAEYQGKDFSMNKVPKDQSFWYESEKVNLTYYNDKNEEMITYDTGTYWVKAELKPEFIAENPDLVFRGNADTSDSAHPETATTRWCKLTVERRKLGLNVTLDSRGMPVATYKSLIEGDDSTGVYEGDTVENGRIAGIHIEYEGIGDTVYPASSTPPTQQGTYKAKAIFYNNTKYQYMVPASENNKEIEFEITKVLPEFSAVDISITYGTPYEVDTTTTSDGALTLTYYLADGKTPVAGNVKPTDAGVYVAKIETAETSNYAADFKTVTITIKKAQSIVNPIVPEKVYYHEGDAMPEIKLSEGDTSGSIKWAAGSTVQLGPHTYTWEYTPSDTKNYESASGEIELNFLPVALGAVKVESFTQGDTVIYAGSDLSVLKSMLKVALYNNDGTKNKDLTDGEYTLTGELVAGESEIRVSSSGFSTTFTVNVTAESMTGINAVFTQGSVKVFATTDIDSLKEYLKVTAVYNSGRTEEIASGDYTLSGTLSVGTSVVTVAYSGKETTFNVTVSEIAVESISAAFTQGTNEVFTSTDISKLKEWLVVTATYNDGSEKSVTDYELAGNLIAGSSYIVVKFGGKETTFTVNVTEVKAVSMDVTYTKGTVFVGASLDTLKGSITVKITYNDGNIDEDFKGYTLEGSLATAGDITVKVRYLTFEKDIVVTVSDITVTNIEITFAQNGTVIFEGSNIDILKDMLTVKVTYSNGDVEEDYKGYTLTGDLSVSGSVTVTVECGDESDTFTVEVTAIEITEITAEFKQGSNAIYPSFDINGLKEWLTVNAIYNDTTKNKTLRDEEYTLSGTLEAGTSTITVTYEGKETTFTVNVSEVSLDRIEVTFEQGDSVIYESAPLDTLKQYMSVKAIYSDKSEKTLEESEYNVTGTLSVSSTILVVEFSGKTATIMSGVTVTKVEAVSMEVTYTEGAVFAGASLDTLRPNITVKVTYNDGNIDEDYKDYALEGSLNVMGESEVKIKVGELEDTITVNVSTSEFIKKPEVTTPSVVFDNEEHTVEEFITGFNDYTMEFVEKPDVIKSVGEYTVRIKIKDDKAVAWEESEDRAEVTLTFSVERLVIDIPSEGGKLEYSGEEQSFVPEGIDTALVTLSGNVGTEVGEYTVTVSLNYPSDTCFTGGSVEDMTFTFSIVKKRLERPTVSAPENIVYTGEEIDVSGMLEGFSSELMTLSGNVKGTNADTYVISVTITDADHYEWAEDESEEIEVALSNNAITIEIEWKINKAKLMPEWTSASGVPTFKVPDKYKDLLKFEYVYEDENGNEVNKEDFESGKTYKVIAKLSEECKGNFEFVTSSGEVLDKPEESAPYEFMPAGGNVTPPDDNEPTEPNTVGMPDWILTWLIVMSCFMGVMLLIMVTMFICMILIAMRKNNGSTVYNYPPYTSQYEEEYEDDDDDEDDEDETDGSGREGEASGREANDGDDKEDDRHTEEIAAANSDSGRYVPEGAVVISEGQLANKDEAKRLEDDGSFYAFEKRDGESVVTVADGAVIINGSERLDIKDSILLLGDDEKRYIFGLRDYAIERSGEKPSFAKYHLTVGKGTKQVIKLSVKDGEVMAYFRIEDERLRTIRRNARENDAEIKIKETEMAVDGESAYEMAKDLIDLRVTQIEENLEYRKQLLKEKRKAKKELSKNSGNQLEDGDGSADRDIDG